MTTEETWKYNASRLTESAIHAEGLIAPNFATAGNALEKQIKEMNDQRARTSQQPLTQAEINATILQEQATQSDHVTAMLLTAEKGETPQPLDLQTLGSFAGSAQSVASSLRGGSLFGALMSIPGLRVLPMVGDFFTTVSRLFLGEKKEGEPQTFGEIWKDVKQERALAPVAQKLGVEMAALKAEMNKPIPASESMPAVTPTTPAPAAAAPSVAPDPEMLVSSLGNVNAASYDTNFNQPNGTFPNAPSRTVTQKSIANPRAANAV